MTDTARKKKQYRRVPFAQMQSIQSRLQLTDAAFSEALGYSPNAIGEWRHSDDAPMVAALAAEALVRRQAHEATTYIVLEIIKGTARVVASSDAPQEVSLNGQAFVLVAKPTGVR